MLLFLDFDGVLHPNSVYLEKGRPTLRGNGELFMWADVLVDIVSTRQNIQIVLSTSWARRLPFIQVKGYLPKLLRNRVIGSTWHHVKSVPRYNKGLSLSYWQDASRYSQIRRWVDFYRVANWIAIDDDGIGWDDIDRWNFIQTKPDLGLSDPEIQNHLMHLLDFNRHK